MGTSFVHYAKFTMWLYWDFSVLTFADFCVLEAGLLSIWWGTEIASQLTAFALLLLFLLLLLLLLDAWGDSIIRDLWLSLLIKVNCWCGWWTFCCCDLTGNLSSDCENLKICSLQWDSCLGLLTLLGRSFLERFFELFLDKHTWKTKHKIFKNTWIEKFGQVWMKM